ncbi:MAG: signal peptidase II [Clostridiales bacterium]|nr:signal peptidase II [Clostridiales bacterium]
MRRAGTLAVTALLVAVDRLTKALAEKYLPLSGGKDIIPGFIAFRYVKNTGAAFSILEGRTAALAVFTAVVSLAGIIWLMSGKVKDKLFYISIMLIVSGGLGNLYDRIFKGYVVDFIEPLFVNFAVFNFADCLVTVGAALLIVYLITDTVRERKKKRGQGE